MLTAEQTAIADELRSHYARVAPLLHAAFGGMPIVSASFPERLSNPASAKATALDSAFVVVKSVYPE